MNLGACGPASGVTVLNALQFRPPVDINYNPYRFWTQQGFIYHECAKKQVGANVFGETLANFSQILSCIGLQTKYAYAKEAPTKVAAQIKDHLKQGRYVIANFNRKLVHEEGGGHFSPIGAFINGYFLLLDVARYKYMPTFIPEDALVQAMASFDPQSARGRGYVAVWA